MSTPTLIAQISDLHIKRPGALAFGRSTPRQRSRDASQRSTASGRGRSWW